jgi:hypothetical protein
MKSRFSTEAHWVELGFFFEDGDGHCVIQFDYYVDKFQMWGSGRDLGVRYLILIFRVDHAI